MKTAVLLPAFNESSTISVLTRKIKSGGLDVVVIDDGSEDGTGNLAEKEGATVIRHPKRRGKGLSLKDGFEYASKNGYEHVITMDADGQHDPEEIQGLMDKARETKASVVVGNRLANPADMPWVRLFTNRFMSGVVSAICHQKIPDTQCGYRLFEIDALNSIVIEARKFEIESELLVKLAKKGYKIESVPIRSIYAGETSQINPLTDTFRFIRFLVRILFRG